MNLYAYWNQEHDVYVVRMSAPGSHLSELPTDALNHALMTFYNQSKVCDPYLYNVWKGNELWGFMVAEQLEMEDESIYQLAVDIVEKAGIVPQTGDYAPQTFKA